MRGERRLLFFPLFGPQVELLETSRIYYERSNLILYVPFLAVTSAEC